MIDINDIAATISGVKSNRNTLSLLLEFQGVLDDLNVFAYENWIKGEVIKGPIVSKYWIEVFLMYAEQDMPNPVAAERLTKHGCHVFFHKDTLTSNVKIKKVDDMLADPDKGGKQVPKTQEMPVFVVKVVMPRHLLTDYNVKKISAMSGEIDLDDVVDAYDQGLDVDRNARNNEETDQDDQDDQYDQ
jgi:hypothetical protein